MDKCKILMLVVWLTCFSATAVDSKFEYAQDVYTVIDNVKSLIRPSLNETQRSRLDKMSIQTSDEGLGAVAFKYPNGQDKVVMALPLIYMNEQLAYAFAYVIETGDSMCLERFVGRQIDLSQLYTSNDAHMADEISDTVFVYFAEKNKRYCKYISRSMLKKDSFQESALILMNMSTTWIVLHEIAHHLFGHTDSSTSCGEKRRQMEEEADLWAVDMMSKINLAFYAADNLHTYFVMIDSIDGIPTENSCHYGNIPRLITMLERDYKIQSDTRCNAADKGECDFVKETIKGKLKNYKIIASRL